MNTFKITVLLLAYFSIGDVKSQDLSFCNTASIVPVQPSIPLPIYDDNARYQASVERNEASLDETQEFIEYYDGIANIGISSEVFLQESFLTYNYYMTQELIVYNAYSRSCKVYDLTNQTIVAIFSPFPTVNINGQLHILSPLNSLFKNPGFNFIYIGKNTIRGIPVNQWRTCAYSDYEKKNYNITVSFTDPTQWKPASIDPSKNITGFESIPVEIFMTTKDRFGSVDTIFYSITDFKPFVDLEIEDYSTPSGVYCPGRKNIKKLPELPESFSFEAQVVEPQQFNDQRGLVSHLYEEYNFKYQLFTYAYDKNNSFTREIHDFNTGLKYTFNQFGTGCEVNKIDIYADGIDTTSSGLEIKLKNPSDFFSFDPDTFHFTGFKRRDGVNTEVWIGPKNLSGFIAYYEWHFMSQEWENSMSPNSKYQTPIYLKVVIDLPLPNSTFKVSTAKSFHLFNFKTDYEVHLNDFDLTMCGNTLKKDFFMFSINTDEKMLNSIKSNQYPFKQSVARLLHEKAIVTLLRISHIELFFDQSTVVVLFTLYERSNYYGNVFPPKNDILSANAIKNLKNLFNSDEIEIMFYNREIDDFSKVKADKNSLKNIDSYEIVYKKHKTGSSPAVVAILTIVFVTLGIVIGIAVTIAEKNQKIQLLKVFY